MELNIITPDQSVFNGQATSVTVPGNAGSFEILKDHAPIISTLEDGKVIIRNNKDIEVIIIKGGVVEVLNNKITVLAEGVIKEEN
ncbi:ATP synthase F1 subunit epsilon [Olivibacter domesticus]|uniref:F-type H+-transporting ATPase subunit epsilon n=1 Tax=Olivibacter domesticus TaxID=407022 RepID=A0A1H7U2A7_OLID1|nr:ATP synthase F1 subunit epsilon [Olivibacter domesticus]SEL90944.1 F-type H+-transporting ATPase subunit epsilon [Olivibacter domesticus]